MCQKKKEEEEKKEEKVGLSLDAKQRKKQHQCSLRLLTLTGQGSPIGLKQMCCLGAPQAAGGPAETPVCRREKRGFRDSPNRKDFEKPNSWGPPFHPAHPPVPSPTPSQLPTSGCLSQNVYTRIFTLTQLLRSSGKAAVVAPLLSLALEAKFSDRQN